jgi:hypothetical protein
MIVDKIELYGRVYLFSAERHTPPLFVNVFEERLLIIRDVGRIHR